MADAFRGDVSLGRRPRLGGKVAIVTGGGSQPTDGHGVGSAISLAFGREGAMVVVADIDEGRGRMTAELIQDEGGSCDVAAVDLRREADAREMVRGAAR